MNPVVLLNGRFVDGSEARVGIDDGAWLHGAGLFETMRAENGRVFRAAAHLGRLRRSAEALLHAIHPEVLPGEAEFAELLRRNGLADARIRLTVSSGSMRPRSDEEGPQLTVCVSANSLSPPPSEAYTEGVTVKLCSFRTSPSDPLAGHKSTSYLARLLGLREAQKARCYEALWFTTRNHLAEGSISNVFVVRGGRLLTPPVETPVLPGVARATVMSLSDELGIESAEQFLSIDDLLDAEEVFLTNVVVQAVPVTRVERRDIGDGTVGPVSRRLLDAFREEVRKECAPK